MCVCVCVCVYIYIYIYIYIYESLCYTPETNSTLQINYTSIKKKTYKKDTFINTLPSPSQIGEHSPAMYSHDFQVAQNFLFSIL